MSLRHGPPARHPSRLDLERVAAEEGAKRGLLVAQVLGVARPAAHVEARKATIRRVMVETGCSINGLSVVWGCDRTAVQRALKSAAAPNVKLRLVA